MSWSYSAGVLTSTGGSSGTPDLLSAGVDAVEAADSTRGYRDGFVAWLNNVEVRAAGSFISIDPDLQLELRGSSFINPGNGGVRHDYRSTLVINTSTAKYDTDLDFESGSTFECRLLYANDPPPRIIYRNSARHDYPNIQTGSTPSAVNIQALDLYNVSVTTDTFGTFLKLYFGLASSASVSRIRFFSIVNTNLKPQFFSTTYNDLYCESLEQVSETTANTITLNRPTFYLTSAAAFTGTFRGAQLTINNPTFLNNCWNQTANYFATPPNDPQSSSFLKLNYLFTPTFKTGLTAIAGVNLRFSRAIQSSIGSPGWSAPSGATQTGTTDSNGTISAVTLLDAYRTGTSPTQLERYNWTLKGRIYDYRTAAENVFSNRILYQGTTNLSAGYNEEIQMIAVTNLAGVSAASAAAITNISLVASGSTSGTATVSDVKTVQNCWNYYRQWIAQLANFDSNDTWLFENSILNISAWNLTFTSVGALSSGSISTSGQITFAVTGTPTFTGIIAASGIVQVKGGGTTTLIGWTFASGATINRDAGSATVVVDSSQIANITAGTGVTLTTPTAAVSAPNFAQNTRVQVSHRQIFTVANTAISTGADTITLGTDSNGNSPTFRTTTPNTLIRFAVNSGGTIPTSSPQIIDGGLYYLKTNSSGVITISITEGGTAIDFTSQGSGTFTLTCETEKDNSLAGVSGYSYNASLPNGALTRVKARYWQNSSGCTASAFFDNIYAWSTTSGISIPDAVSVAALPDAIHNRIIAISTIELPVSGSQTPTNDGSTVTGLTIALEGTGRVQINANDADGILLIQDIYAWGVYVSSTQTGIRLASDTSFVATDLFNYTIANMEFDNTGSIPLRIIGGRVTDQNGNTPIASTTSASIFPNVEQFGTGAIVNGTDATTIATTVFSTTVETGYSFMNVVRLMASILGGRRNNSVAGSTVTTAYRDLNNTKDRLTGTLSTTDGDRTITTIDLN